jgi:putative ABC transport system permease protein
MKLRDLTEVSFRNLRRTKLRTSLTTTGVMIAIATFVAMLSFAAGNQRYFTTAFNEFGFINQMSVWPPESQVDEETARVLDADAIRDITGIPGVRLAFPYSTFSVKASVLDTTVTTETRALAADAFRTKLFDRVLGGAKFSSDTAREAIVTPEFIEQIGASSDSIVGKELVVSMRVVSIDSAIVAAAGNPRLEMMSLMSRVDQDSVYLPDYQRRFIRTELTERLQRFMDGLFERQVTVADTLAIIAVTPDDREYRLRTAPIVISEKTAQRLHSAGVALGGNPADLLAAARDGTLLDPAGAYGSRGYPRVTLEIEPLANHTTVKDSVEALGFRAYSFAEQFEDMQRFMVYFYLGLGVVGLIALLTASLGIINTLIMSITERRREIGILKSLGAHESDIQHLFLVESGAIGLMGSVVGITVGWVGTRIIAAIGKVIMTREEMPVFDPFALPLWLIGLALAFGVLVSVLAGLYPAARAARVDPVEALRNE